MTRPVHIAYIHETLDWGGAEVLRRTVTRFMQKDARWQGRFRLTLICLRDAGPVGDLIAQDGVEVIGMGWQGKLPSWRLVRALTRLLRNQRPDIVHTCLYQAHRHGIAAARLAGCSVVLMEEHGLNDWWMGRRERLLSVAMAYAATRVVAVSHAHAEHLMRVMHYPRYKLHVVPNCIDPERLGGAPQFAVRRAEGRSLTSIGGLRHMKRHSLLLQAFRLVLRRLPECQLNIVGEGPLREELESLARSLGIDKHVGFWGTCHDVRDILANTDVYVHAGHMETFCIAMAEAMYAGCACVGVRTAVMEELTDHGQVAVLVPPEDPEAMAEAVVDMLGAPDIRAQMGEKAAEYVNQHYLPQHHVASMMALYEELLDRDGDPGEMVGR